MASDLGVRAHGPRLEVEITSGAHGMFLWWLGSTMVVHAHGSNSMWHARMVVVGIFFKKDAALPPCRRHASHFRGLVLVLYDILLLTTVDFSWIFNPRSRAVTSVRCIRTG